MKNQMLMLTDDIIHVHHHEMYKGGAYFMGLFGSPGVGKTFLALYKALEEVLDKSNSFKQVVVVRSLVQLRDVGFLPGDLNEKQEIYELPYKEISATLFGRNDAWDRLKEQGHVRFISTTAIRGISIDDAIIIVDEGVHVPGFLAGDVVLDIEALDLACNPAGEVRRIKAGDGTYTGAPSQQVGPAVLHGIAHRADETQPGDDDAPARHAFWFLTA